MILAALRFSALGLAVLLAPILLALCALSAGALCGTSEARALLYRTAWLAWRSAAIVLGAVLALKAIGAPL